MIDADEIRGEIPEFGTELRAWWRDDSIDFRIEVAPSVVGVNEIDVREAGRLPNPKPTQVRVYVHDDEQAAELRALLATDEDEGNTE